MSPERIKPVEPITDEEWETPIALNYRGTTSTYSLREWLIFCTEDDLDPQKVEAYARDLLEGRLPFHSQDISLG
jgi:hypothetical protein